MAWLSLRHYKIIEIVEDLQLVVSWLNIHGYRKQAVVATDIGKIDSVCPFQDRSPVNSQAAHIFIS